MKLSTLFFLTLLVFPAFSQIIKVEISGIKTEKGVILLSVYRDNKTFKAETPFRVYNFSKESMVGGKIEVAISDLKAGIYGIALIDDTNNNGKMDFRLFMPTEGFGFSNYSLKGNRKPDFEVFSFCHSNENTTVTINIQYP